MKTSAKIWMPLYIGDYLAETAHLSTLQHGAYLLLMMHYWRKQGLPREDRQLAHVVRMSTRGWQHIKPAIQDLFNEDWSHDGLDAQIRHQRDLAAKNAANGSKGGNRTAMNRVIAEAKAASNAHTRHPKLAIHTTKSRPQIVLCEPHNPRNPLNYQLSHEAKAAITLKHNKDKEENTTTVYEDTGLLTAVPPDAETLQ